MSFLKHLLPAWKISLQNKTTANGAILNAIEQELKDTEREAIKGKLLLALDTATEEWLDYYGKLFGVLRRDNELDDPYRQRIINYVLLRRGTIPAIIAAIREFLNDYDSHIEIYEPYKNVFILNKSKLNGPDHFLGHYYTVAVIDIRISRPFPPGIIDLINEFKPAGVTVRLTYRSGSHNPNAPVIEAGVSLVETSTRLRTMNGMNDRIRGHLNLTTRSRADGDDQGIFILNKSKLNSLDKLAGARSVTNPAFNLASFSTDSIEITEATSLTDVQNSTTEMSPDFYAKTGDTSDQYASQLLPADQESYMYFTLDVGTFFDLRYSAYLREVEPSGNYTKNTYLSLMDNTAILYNLKAAVSPTEPTDFKIQLFNFETGEWATVDESQAVFRQKGNKVKIADFSNYLSEKYLVFSRILFEPNEEMSDYEAHLHFFELSFSKEVAIRPTIKIGVQEVTNTGTLKEIE
ncbi:hypothetical protein [Bacillus phage phiAGATE]|uniref:Baseplate protein n=1 Tax=Bacillus phage phiAGATE TaxID=1204533 RepID=L0LC67_9CAUD|nr:baseplate protein [Bacillus phage phiAGATE]AGB62785.1 hypothetical protein [Bacillus phage phiAGATE]